MSNFILLQAIAVRTSGQEAATFDFAYIDADKTGYADYFRLCLPLLRPGGLMAVDNTLFRVGVSFRLYTFGFIYLNYFISMI